MPLRRALLVHEDHEFRGTLAAEIEQLDVIVDQVFDFHGAISKLIRNEYDLVLCDAKKSPGSMHGGHIARWIAEMKLAIPVKFVERAARIDFAELDQRLARRL